MYKAILVDDERIVKLAIKSMIQWEATGLELVGTAGNGAGALQLIEKTRPDIVITDIKMPGMDGVELIRTLKEREFEGEILVLSNYNDFELVREAMRYGAYDYVLKVTVKSDDFSKLLKEMTAKLEKKRGSTRAAVLPEADTGAKRDRLLKQLAEPDPSELNRIIDELSKVAPLNREDRIYTFVLKAVPAGAEQAGLQLAGVLHSLAGEFMAKSSWYSVLDIDKHTALIAAVYRQSNTAFTPRSLAERLAELAATYYNVRLGIVYAEPAEGYKQWNEYTGRCLRVSELTFYSRFEDQPLSMDAAISEEEQLLDGFCRTKAESVTEHFLKEGRELVLEDFGTMVGLAAAQPVNPYRLKKYVKRLLREVERRLIYQGYCQEELFDEYRNDEDAIYAAPTEARLLLTLEALLESARSRVAVERMSCRREVREALEYIDKHARERIALADIARQVNLNENYLCKVFKDDTGKSVVHYVNELKMKIAWEALNKGDVRIKEAAALVGIEDPFYFNRLFKKFYGITPREIRNK